MITFRQFRSFQRVESRKALRTWALSEDRRPAVRMQRVAVRAWSTSSKRAAWRPWAAAAQGWARRALAVHGLRERKRAEALRRAWAAWRFERLRGLRARLEGSVDERRALGKRQLLKRWHGTLTARGDAFEAALLQSTILALATNLSVPALQAVTLLESDALAAGEPTAIPSPKPSPQPTVTPAPSFPPSPVPSPPPTAGEFEGRSLGNSPPGHESSRGLCTSASAHAEPILAATRAGLRSKGTRPPLSVALSRLTAERDGVAAELGKRGEKGESVWAAACWAERWTPQEVAGREDAGVRGAACSEWLSQAEREP